MDSIQKCTMEAVSSLELEQVTEYKDIQLIGCVISPKNLLFYLCYSLVQTKIIFLLMQLSLLNDCGVNH